MRKASILLFVRKRKIIYTGKNDKYHAVVQNPHIAVLNTQNYIDICDTFLYNKFSNISNKKFQKLYSESCVRKG